jgi:hypothetical protein
MRGRCDGCLRNGTRQTGEAIPVKKIDGCNGEEWRRLRPWEKDD